MNPEKTSVPEDLAKVKAVWNRLGQEDPFWAVASRDDRRANQWQMDEFLGTGSQDVEAYRALLKRHASAPDRLGSVLDFGCGVGRLSRVWLQHADRVVGVDISAPMLEQARKIVGEDARVTFLLNQASDLATVGEERFDLVFSHICLMHMPWSLARTYVSEFARICSPGGWVAFQLPTRRIATAATLASRIRRTLVESLPFGLGAAWRRWRHGTSVSFDVYFTPADEVRSVAAAAGLKLLHAEPSLDGGKDSEGFIYIFRKA
jgi:SAM-dependent methyltransferase